MFHINARKSTVMTYYNVWCDYKRSIKKTFARLKPTKLPYDSTKTIATALLHETKEYLRSIITSVTWLGSSVSSSVFFVNEILESLADTLNKFLGNRPLDKITNTELKQILMNQPVYRPRHIDGTENSVDGTSDYPRGGGATVERTKARTFAEEPRRAFDRQNGRKCGGTGPRDPFLYAQQLRFQGRKSQIKRFFTSVYDDVPIRS